MFITSPRHDFEPKLSTITENKYGNNLQRIARRDTISF